MHLIIVPMEKPIQLGHYIPLLLENIHESAHGLQDEICIDHSPPGQVVHVDQALAVGGRCAICLVLEVLTLAIFRPRVPFLSF